MPSPCLLCTMWAPFPACLLCLAGSQVPWYHPHTSPENNPPECV